MFRFLLSMVMLCTTAFSALSQTIVIGGIVQDGSSKKALENVSVFIPGSSIGTVSNAEGAFSLKIPAKYASKSIKAEHLGYFSSEASIKNILLDGGRVTLLLAPAAKQLKEVIVYGGNAEDLVREALNKVSLNYSKYKTLFSAFYRETIQKGRRYIGVSEAMIDIFKTPYTKRLSAGERVEIKKGRRLISQNGRDTLSIKIVGGPIAPVALDFVKNEDFLFGTVDLSHYNFTLQKPVNLDDRLQYVVRFEARTPLEYALHQGLLYIDQKTLAFTRAEFELDISDKEKATRAILRKKPAGLRFKPLEVAFVVTYKMSGGVSYINYVSSKIRFKCDWKRRLFSSEYATSSEMVMVEREDNTQRTISRKASFGDNDVFYDAVKGYWDSNFWHEYNIIEPTESLEKAVGKLKKRNAAL